MLYLRHTADAVNLRIQARRIFLHLRGPGRGGHLVVAVKRGHHFLTQSLDRMESLRVAGRVRTVTLRVAVARGSGRWELAVVTIHL